MPEQVKPQVIKLGTFTIKASHSYYWIVRCKIPLQLAQRVYLHRLGAQIRVDGDAEGAAPEWPRIAYYAKSGKPIRPTAERLECERYLQSDSVIMKRSATQVLEENEFADDVTVGEGFAELYHIDSDEALAAFLELCRLYGLFAPALPTMLEPSPTRNG